MAKPFADDLEYLRAEAEWVLLRARRKSLDEAFGEDREALEVERERLKRREDKQRRKIDGRLAAGRGAGQRLALDVLCDSCGLDAFERTVLLLATSACFTRESVQPRRRRSPFDDLGLDVTVQRCFEFAELDFAERVRRRATFRAGSPLRSFDLIKLDHSRRASPQELLRADVELTASTFARVCGTPELTDEMLEFTTIEEPRATMEQVVLEPEDRRRLLAVVDRYDEYLARRREWGLDAVIRYGRGAVMLFYGEPGTGKTMTAHALAHRMGKRLMLVDARTMTEESEAGEFLPSLFREARLNNAILFLDECELLFADRRFNRFTAIMLTELERFEGTAILATNLPEELDPAVVRRLLVRLHFKTPSRAARHALWTGLLPDGVPLASDVDLDRLAERFELTGGLIKNAVLCAVADALQEEGEPVVTMAHLESAALIQLRSPLTPDSKVVEPRASMADLVVSPALRRSLDEVVDAARDRHTVLERWGLGRRLTHAKGIAALLHGPPGTGKTLCAEAVAFELGRPLCVLGAADILSKYVGEAEKNLEQAFSEARARDAVLFIDEADWLLSPRGSGRTAHHQDQLVNTALKAIEQHPGVVLLATNLRDALDPALARRMMYHLHFDLPDAVSRSTIWRRHLPESVPTREPLDFDRLGARYVMSGGLIRNAAFKAAFRAARSGEPLTQLTVESAAREVCHEVPIERRGPIGFAGERR